MAGTAGWPVPVTVFHGTLADWAPRGGDGVAWSRLLGSDEPRYAAMRHGGTRDRFAAARRLLKHVCAARFGTEPAEIEIGYQPGGRPHLVGGGMPDISISHTRDIVAVAVSDTGPVGVDVEHADRPLLDYGLAPRVCTRREQEDLAAVPAQWRNRYLVQLWTVKESYVKALGLGLAADPGRVGFSLYENPRGHLARPHSGGAGSHDVPDAATWQFRLTTVAGGYALACAVQTPRAPLSPPHDSPPLHHSPPCPVTTPHPVTIPRPFITPHPTASHPAPTPRRMTRPEPPAGRSAPQHRFVGGSVRLECPVATGRGRPASSGDPTTPPTPAANPRLTTMTT